MKKNGCVHRPVGCGLMAICHLIDVMVIIVGVYQWHELTNGRGVSGPVSIQSEVWHEGSIK